MQNIIRTMEQQLSRGNDVVLVTITAASGATPRGAGARMLVGKDGRLCGTIGGGAVEYRAIIIAQNVLSDKRSDLYSFSLNRDDVENLGMICGGAVQVFFHYLPSDDHHILLADTIKKRMETGDDLWLLSDLSGGGSLSVFGREDAPSPLLSDLTRHPKRIQLDRKDMFLEQISFSSRVYIFGGGHVAQELVPVLSHVGFRCVVMDDRPEFADPSLFPCAEKVLMGDFTKIYNYISLTQEDFVCVMTRGHAYDTQIQAQLLQSSPCYIGVIGSASKAAGVRKALIEEYGLTNEDADRITTPIGLSIKAETPAEIAISIAAQLIAVRAQRQ